MLLRVIVLSVAVLLPFSIAAAASGFNPNCANIRCIAPGCDAHCSSCSTTPVNPFRGPCCATSECKQCNDGYTVNAEAPATCTQCPMLKCAEIQPDCGGNCTDCVGTPNLTPGTTCRGCGLKESVCRSCEPEYLLRNGRCVASDTDRESERECPLLKCFARLPCDENCVGCKQDPPQEGLSCPGCWQNVCRECKPGFHLEGSNLCKAL